MQYECGDNQNIALAYSAKRIKPIESIEGLQIESSKLI